MRYHVFDKTRKVKSKKAYKTLWGARLLAIRLNAGMESMPPRYCVIQKPQSNGCNQCVES